MPVRIFQGLDWAALSVCRMDASAAFSTRYGPRTLRALFLGSLPTPTRSTLLPPGSWLPRLLCCGAATPPLPVHCIVRTNSASESACWKALSMARGMCVLLRAFCLMQRRFHVSVHLDCVLGFLNIVADRRGRALCFFSDCTLRYITFRQHLLCLPSCEPFRCRSSIFLWLVSPVGRALLKFLGLLSQPLLPVSLPLQIEKLASDWPPRPGFVG